MQVTPQDMLELAKLIKQLCGLALDDTKGYLIESRLSQLAADAGCATYVELCRRAINGDRQLRTQVVDAITTHETLFFRDNSPFNVLQHRVIPDLIDSKAKSPLAKRLRIWCAACSSGQECYSIAIVLSELLPDIATWNINILGTDIADSSVAQASRGLYSAYEVGRGMPPQFLGKYMVREGANWRVRDPLRALVHFERRDLLENFSSIGPFDVIFCRNVAIYFDAPTRQSLFLRLADRLTPTGYLFVGASESLADLGPRFAPKMHCRSIFYQPNLTTPTPARR
jgi:chemotaxis protein methyltransferase CheR